MITQDIVVSPSDDRLILPEKHTFIPAIIWLFNDKITIYNSRTDTYEDVIISSNSSNSLLPVTNQCDNDLGSNYFPNFTDLCYNGDNIRIYSLGIIDHKVIIDKIVEYLRDIYPNDYTFFQPDAVKYNNTFDTYLSTLFFLSSHKADVYACHVEHFRNAPGVVMEYVLDNATRAGCNVFIDTGISHNRSVFNQVYGASLNFGYEPEGWHSPIFIVLNLPLIPVSMVDPYSITHQGLRGRYNILLFHGHVQLPGREVAGYIPTSTFYGTILSEKAKTDYYSSIVDRVMFVAKGTNVNVRKTQYIGLYDRTKINFPYVDSGYIYLSFPRTTETQNDLKILLHENNARLAVDVAIDLIYRFRSIIGMSNSDEDVVKQKIVTILNMVNDKFAKLTTAGQFQKLALRQFKIEKNKLYIDVTLAISSVIMHINLVVSAS